MKPLFAQYLQQESVLFLDGNTKKDVMRDIVQRAAMRCTMDENQISEALWQRERMMTTGIGEGLALPHIRVSGFSCPLIIVGICKNNILDYDSVDKKPVRLIIFLAADEKDQTTYINLLGSISKKLKEPGVIQEVLAVDGDPAQVVEILSK